jgi:hypothetical protein
VPFVTSQNQQVSTTNWADVRTGGSRIGKISEGLREGRPRFRQTKLTSIVYDETKGKYGGQRCVRLNSEPNHDGLNQEALVINFDDLQAVQPGAAPGLGRHLDALPLGDRSLLLQRELDPGQNIRFGDNGVLLFRFRAGTVDFVLPWASASPAEGPGYAAYGQATSASPTPCSSPAACASPRTGEEPLVTAAASTSPAARRAPTDNNLVRSLAHEPSPLPESVLLHGHRPERHQPVGRTGRHLAPELGGKAGHGCTWGRRPCLRGYRTASSRTLRRGVPAHGGRPSPEPHQAGSWTPASWISRTLERRCSSTPPASTTWKDQRVFTSAPPGCVQQPAGIRSTGGEVELSCPRQHLADRPRWASLHSEITDATGPTDKGGGSTSWDTHWRWCRACPPTWPSPRTSRRATWPDATTDATRGPRR